MNIPDAPFYSLWIPPRKFTIYAFFGLLSMPSYHTTDIMQVIPTNDTPLSCVGITRIYMLASYKYFSLKDSTGIGLYVRGHYSTQCSTSG